MVPFFVQIKCHLGKSYRWRTRSPTPRSPPRSIRPPATSTCWCKFYVEDATDIGHFVNEKVQVIPGIQDTRTIITFKAFG